MANTTSILNNAGQSQTAVTPRKGSSAVTIINSVLDTSGMRKRIDELMGSRAPQFVSSIVSLVNSNEALTEAVRNAPQTVIASAIKAASYDLPIDPGLGMAYIVPFRNRGQAEAQFILGYKGMVQLALRTGAYSKLNVQDVREGELKKFDRLTEEVEIEWIENDDEREKLPIVGWLGYMELVNGFSKKIYWSVERCMAHEKKHRKGQYMGQGWRDNPEAMQRKTVLRDLIGHWGLMSIDYHMQKESAAADALSESIAEEEADIINVDDYEVTPEQETPENV